MKEMIKNMIRGWLLAIAAVGLVLMATQPAQAAFACHKTPELRVNVGEEKYAFIEASPSYNIIDVISQKHNTARFDTTKERIAKILGEPAPWPIDEFLVFEPKSEADRKARPLIVVAYSYDDCILSYTVFDKANRNKIFGNDI